MNEKITKEDYDKARKHFEEQEFLRQLEREERTAADRAANPEKYANLNGKAAILPETHLNNCNVWKG